MTCLTSRVSVLLAFLLLYFWRAKVYASGNSGEEIDFTYVIIGVTLGVFLAIAFIAVIICMIKTQMIDNVFGESDGKLDRRRRKKRHTKTRRRMERERMFAEKTKVKHGIKPKQR